MTGFVKLENCNMMLAIDSSPFYNYSVSPRRLSVLVVTSPQSKVTTVILSPHVCITTQVMRWCARCVTTQGYLASHIFYYWHLVWYVVTVTHIVTTPTQPQLNSTVGCDMKMTLIHHPPPPPTTHHPATQTQCQQYHSCYWSDFNQTLNLGSWDEQQQQ